MRKLWFVLVLLFFQFPLLLAQSDVPESEDHPLLSRYPGSYIADYETFKYREYVLATGEVSGYRYIQEKDTIAGQLTRITYYINEAPEALSIGEVYQDYLQAVQKAGLKIITKGFHPQANVKKSVGGGTWMGVALGPNSFDIGSAANKLLAGSSSSGGTFAIISQLKQAEGNTFLAIYGERHSSDLLVFHVDVIEQKSAETGNVSVDADYIRSVITDKGSIALYGISFAYDSDEIQDESRSTLKEIAAYLKSVPNHFHYVVGHTDMKGSFEYNMKLSQKRADAILKALVEDYNVPKDQLAAHGIGFLAPKATNATSEGRSLNRRTELVLQKP
jgi:outer membrane protein OmpA-like peptidoglycan-associated protein